jgi:hypothetical protein
MYCPVDDIEGCGDSICRTGLGVVVMYWQKNELLLSDCLGVDPALKFQLGR